MPTLTVTSTNDSGPGSLRNAVLLAAPGDTITFDVSGTLTLLSPIELNKNLTINGPGPKIRGNTTRIFTISGSETLVTLRSLTFANGVDNTGQGGGAILNNGAALVVVSCTFTNNKSSTSDGTGNGGAIANSGIAAIASSTFYANTATNGGAIANMDSGNLSISNTTFSMNTAAAAGGAIANIDSGTVNIGQSTFSSNKAGNSGEAIANLDSGTVTVTSCSFTSSTSITSGVIANSPPGTVTSINNTLIIVIIGI